MTDPRLLPPDHPDYTPFGEDRPRQERPSRPFGNRHEPVPLDEQARIIRNSGMDADSFVFAKEKAKGRKRKTRPDFKPNSQRYWEALGYEWENREVTHSIFIAGLPISYTVDYLGIIDATITKGNEIAGLQICSLEALTSHIRKMCSDEPMKGAYRKQGKSRRANLIEWLGKGRKLYAEGYYQPDGFGTKWLNFIREVTLQDVEAVIAGKQIKSGFVKPRVLI